jgi:hypothetical protein
MVLLKEMLPRHFLPKDICSPVVVAPRKVASWYLLPWHSHFYKPQIRLRKTKNNEKSSEIRSKPHPFFLFDWTPPSPSPSFFFPPEHSLHPNSQQQAPQCHTSNYSDSKCHRSICSGSNCRESICPESNCPRGATVRGASVWVHHSCYEVEYVNMFCNPAPPE